MGEFRYVSDREANARHRAAKPSAARRPVPIPPADPDVPFHGGGDQIERLRNVTTVLALGETRYITFRKRVYRVDPVPFKMGQRVLDLNVQVITDLKTLAVKGKKEDSAHLYTTLHTLALILWTHLQPTKRWRRLFKRLRLLRNPCLLASERELMDLTNFFLQCRMASSVRSSSEAGLSISDRAIPMS